MPDTLADSLNMMKVAELNGKSSVLVKPFSKILEKILKIFKEKEFIESFDLIDDARGGEISIKLAGKINECKAIRPRFNLKFSEWEKFENRFLPAVSTGIIIVSTSKGIMTHMEAKENRLGGRLIAYVY